MTALAAILTGLLIKGLWVTWSQGSGDSAGEFNVTGQVFGVLAFIAVGLWVLAFYWALARSREDRRLVLVLLSIVWGVLAVALTASWAVGQIKVASGWDPCLENYSCPDQAQNLLWGHALVTLVFGAGALLALRAAVVLRRRHQFD